ncbi:hypothetical protein ACT7C6_02480 [Bacillus paranthracis]
MQTENKMLTKINKFEKRLNEAKRIQKHLEKQNAPLIRIHEIKRIVNFLEHEYNVHLFASKMVKLTYQNKKKELILHLIFISKRYKKNRPHF